MEEEEDEDDETLQELDKLEEAQEGESDSDGEKKEDAPLPEHVKWRSFSIASGCALETVTGSI